MLLAGFLSVVGNDKGAASSDLSSLAKILILAVTLLVFALAGPFSEILSLVNIDEWDFVLLGKSSDKLLVFGVIAVFGEDAEVCVLSVESFTDLVESLDKTLKQR